MDQLSFFNYHNRHIRFEYNGEIMSGVVVDSLSYDEKAFPTEYIYIPTSQMRAWKDAESSNNVTEMRRLEQRIDLRDLRNPSLINH